jgi:hypothetical protein
MNCWRIRINKLAISVATWHVQILPKARVKYWRQL